ncbi:hypothetical protein H1C71_024728, partial [Ictidomys tridecemlineatus]
SQDATRPPRPFGPELPPGPRPRQDHRFHLWTSLRPPGTLDLCLGMGVGVARATPGTCWRARRCHLVEPLSSPPLHTCYPSCADSGEGGLQFAQGVPGADPLADLVSSGELAFCPSRHWGPRAVSEL